MSIDASRVPAAKLSRRDKCDIFLYNGEIGRGADLRFIRSIHENQKHETCKVIMTTPGGDPDAAYKISRYTQDKYKKFELLLGGLCKSAGTLIAMGAHELIFSPYGELGPLDVQMPKEDSLSALHSGLNISEALQSLERRAIDTHLRIIMDIVAASQGVVSFQTASHSAAEVLASLYGPVFSQIDPEDVGGRTRSLRIAVEYGKRLDAKVQNAKPDAVRRLAETYPSHGFVIDRTEARALFRAVRDADDVELELIEALGDLSRWPLNSQRPMMTCLSNPAGEASNAIATATKPSGGPVKPVGANSTRAGKSSRSAPGRGSSRKGRTAARSVQGNVQTNGRSEESAS